MHNTTGNPEGGIDDNSIEALKAGVQTDRLDFLEGFSNNFFSVDGELKVSEATKQYFKRIATMASAKGTLDCITAFCCTDFRDDLKNCDVPALVIHGDADAIVPFAVSGKRVVEMLNNCELALIEGGPHGLNASHKAAFNQALLDFLSE